MSALHRLTRRSPLAMTEAAHRRLRRLALETGMDRDEALTFLLENLDGIADAEALAARLRRFRTERGKDA